ncbi:MAG: TolC family protein, partial [Synergistaceae bacterium]|nr:TolC family protein [Synergistaceae bacterium]
QDQGGDRESDINGFEIKLGITQPIDVSGRFGLRERREILSCELRRANLERDQNNLLAEAETTYWSAVIAAENVALQRDVLQRRMENKRIANEKYRMKIAPKLDPIRAEAQVMAAKALVAEAEAERLDMLAAMASLTGGIEAEPTEKSVAALSPDTYQPSDISTDKNPEVYAGHLAVELAAIEKKLAAKENTPSVEASVNWIPFASSSSGSPERGEMEASIRFDIPLLDGGAAKNKISSAETLAESAAASLRHIENRARYEAATAKNAWNRAVALERAKRSEMEMSNEELRITELMYREGMGAQIDLINAEIENHKVSAEYLDAVKNMYISMIQIRRINGDYAEKWPLPWEM